MGELAAACAREGIVPCWYHSIMDWHHPDYLPRRDWEKDRPTEGADFDRYNRYLKEQARIGRMGGADWVPESVAELERYVEEMRPLMAVTEQFRSFLDFVAGKDPEAPVSRRERFDRWVSIRASMALMPEWARRLTGTWQPELVRRLWLEPSDRLKARVVRWVEPRVSATLVAVPACPAIPAT